MYTPRKNFKSYEDKQNYYRTSHMHSIGQHYHNYYNKKYTRPYDDRVHRYPTSNYTDRIQKSYSKVYNKQKYLYPHKSYNQLQDDTLDKWENKLSQRYAYQARYPFVKTKGYDRPYKDDSNKFGRAEYQQYKSDCYEGECELNKLQEEQGLSPKSVPEVRWDPDAYVYSSYKKEIPYYFQGNKFSKYNEVPPRTYQHITTQPYTNTLPSDFQLGTLEDIAKV